MVCPASLLSEKPNGEQIVRRPRATDAIGALLERVYAIRRAAPDVITRLLARIDRSDDTRDRRITDRR